MMFREAWNQCVESLLGRRVFPGANCRVQWLAHAQLIEGTPGAVWRHPWFTTAEWRADDSAAGGGWVARVKAGFVNGVAPTMATTVGNAPAATLDREKATKAQGVNLSNLKAAIDSPLFDSPAMSLNWRAIGLDGDSGEVVPAFFAALGVNAQQATTTEDADTGLINTSAATIPEGNRLLRACDIVLVRPRAGITVSISLGNIADSSVGLLVTVENQPQDTSAKAHLVARATGVQPTVIYGTTALDYEDTCTDELLISTVYLLSPPNTPFGSDPDMSWTPYAKHAVFWNLHWQQPLGAPSVNNNPLSLSVPYAGGVAQLTVNWLLSNVNDANEAAYAILEAHDMTGSFWTI